MKLIYRFLLVLGLVVFVLKDGVSQAPFITTWKTDNPGSSCSSCITIPTFPGETYNYDVDWENDGNYDEFGIAGDVTHDFGVVGTHMIALRGNFPRIYFNDTDGNNTNEDSDKLISIDQWGDIEWESMEYAFRGCDMTIYNAFDSPNLLNANSLKGMFMGCNLFNGDISNWSVGTITDFSQLFWGATNFNQPLNNWDMSAAQDLNNMFKQANLFNQPIGLWNVSNVINMRALFSQAGDFNQDIGNWNVGNVQNMSNMFGIAHDFNQDISQWNISSVTNMSNMFNQANSFNFSIENWDVSGVENMGSMFFWNINFNQDLNGWDLSSVIQIGGIFENSGFSCENYSNNLISWANNPNTPSNLNLGGLTNMEYGNGEAETARNFLINDLGWTISGDSQGSCTFSACPTDYTITYPEFVCLGESFDFQIEIIGGDGPFDITVTDGTSDYGSLSGVTGASFTIPAIDPANGIYIFNISISDNGSPCTDIIRTSSSTGEMTIQSGGFSLGVPSAPVCFMEPYDLTISVFPNPSSNPPYMGSVTGIPGGVVYSNSSNTEEIIISIPGQTQGTYEYSGSSSDNNGCAYVGPLFISNVEVKSEGISDVTLPANPTCEEAPYQIQVDIFEGIPPYQIDLFANGSFVNSQTVGNIGDVSAMALFDINNQTEGTYNYTITISDQQSCSYQIFYSADNHTVSPIPEISDIGLIQACQESMEQVTIDLTQYDDQLSLGNTISWSFESDGSSLISAPSSFTTGGSITIFARATSTNDCQSEILPVEIILSNSPTPTITSSDPNNSICPNVSIDLNVEESFDSFSWSTNEDSQTVSVNEPGIYTVTVTSGECQGENEIMISEIGISNISCLAISNSISFNTTNAQFPISISWSGPTNGNVSEINDAVYSILDLPDGEYTIVVTDNNGCEVSCESTVNTGGGGCLHPDIPNLIAFYNSTNGENWDIGTGWIEGEAGMNCDPCDLANGGANPWFGITCDEQNERVTEIELVDNDLTGNITLLSELDSLRRIVLSDNDLTGGNWNFDNQQLRVIAIGGNSSLKTTLPDFNLPLLEEVYSYGDSLIGPLPSWTNVPKLRDAFIYDNPYNSDIPVWELDSLRNLSLYNCGLVGQLPSLTSSTKLFSFYADFNHLEGEIPEYLDKLELDTFILINNNLSGCVPTERYCDIGWFDVNENLLLPFHGDTDMLCQPIDQIGAICDDNDATTINDMIQSDCSCSGESNGESRPFVTTWVTNNPGVTSDSSIKVPTHPDGTYNYEVDWDYVMGTAFVADTTGIDGDFEYNFGREDTVTIAIRGEFPRIFFNDIGPSSTNDDSEKIIFVEQWGDIGWTSMEFAFQGCENINVIADDTPNLSGVISLESMFEYCRFLDSDFNNWDVSTITSLKSLFSNCNRFNGNISSWKVMNVIDMSSTFWSTDEFNTDISGWDVSKVNSMEGMFRNATSFNQDLNTWDVENVETFWRMFWGATIFNGNINNWQTLSSTNMRFMFRDATMFNQDISSWEIQNVNALNGMFQNAESFDQNLGSWDINPNGIFSNDMTGFFDLSGMSCANYSLTLQEWADNILIPMGINFSADAISYNDAGEVAKTILASKGWNITGDTYSLNCNSPCPSPDYDVLQALYESTNGDQWSNKDGWLSNCDPCDSLNNYANPWFGLCCNEITNRVIGIDMFGFVNCSEIGGVFGSGNNLSGELPLNIGDLEFIEFFDVQENNITGNLPSSVTKWSNLRYFDLEDNNFTGQIPQGFGELDDISRFDIQGNNFSGRIPDDLGNITPGDLINIFLDNNNLEGCIPSSFSNYCNVSFPSDVTLDGNPLLSNRGEDWMQYCDNITDEKQENQPCGIALDSIIINCNCVAVEDCPTPICKTDITETIFVQEGRKIPIERILENGFPVRDCYSFDPVMDVDTFLLICADVCTIKEVTVYSLTTGESCTTDVYVNKLAGVCSEFVAPDITVELIDQGYIGGEFISIDVILDGLVDITEYSFQIQFDTFALEFIEGINLNNELTPTVDFFTPAGPYVRVKRDDNSQSINSIFTPTRVATLVFRIKNQPFCGETTFDIASDAFNAFLTCQSISAAIEATYISTNVIYNHPLPITNPTLLEVCKNEEITVNIINSEDYQSITWQETGSDELSVAPVSTSDYGLSLIDNNGCSIDTLFTITVIDCSDCIEGACLFDNPPTFINPPSDITVSCIEDMPSLLNLEFTNGMTDDCLEAGFVPTMTDSTSFANCQGTIMESWNYATICGELIEANRIITVESPGTLMFVDTPSESIDINCNEEEIELYKITLDYMFDGENNCIPTGSVSPVTTENFDECGGTVTYTWSVNNPCGDPLTYTQVATVASNNVFEFTAPPIDITLSCNQLPFEPATLLITNNMEGACGVSQEVSPVSAPTSPVCPGTIVNTWAFVNPCTNEQLSHVQIVTLVDCAAATLEKDYIEVRAGDIYDIDLFANDIIPDSFSTQIIEIEREELFLAKDYEENGVFEFAISESFFDTLQVTYEVCNLECDNCTTKTLNIVDEELKDIILTDIFTPNGDGQNDALRFNFEEEIMGSQLYIYNRWGDKIYEKLNYTNDWDASGYPGGVYFYVLRIGDATVKKTLTVVK